MTTFPEPDAHYPASTVNAYQQPDATLVQAQSNERYAVVTRNLVRRFDQKLAVNNLNLAVREGEFLWISGTQRRR